ncbi:histidine kinase dimerization/phospho-acceptor domain-containing protein [Hominifimenecus microfluidus]|uniref:sensor histidine kinase n=1 Tax=Hominifimenecus microfluidus TaxID=2885348 RepID=UPI0032C1A54E
MEKENEKNTEKISEKNSEEKSGKKEKRKKRRRWIVEFLCLGISGASLAGIFFALKNSRFLYALQGRGYAATREFAELFAEDVKKAIHYTQLRRELETNGELDYGTNIRTIKVSDQQEICLTLQDAIDYGESLGFYFDEDQRLVTRKESDGSDELSGPAALREAAEAEMNNITETVVGSDVTTNDDTSAASGTENRADAAATSPEEDSDQGEQVYFPSEEELQTYQNGEAAERITLLNMLYDLADYYQLQNYLCVKEGETNFAYCFVYSLEDGRILLDQNLGVPGNKDDIVGLGAYFCISSETGELTYNFYQGGIGAIYEEAYQDGMLEGTVYDLSAGVDITFPYNDQYTKGAVSYQHFRQRMQAMIAAFILSVLLVIAFGIRIVWTGQQEESRMDSWCSELVLLWGLTPAALFAWSVLTICGAFLSKNQYLLAPAMAGGFSTWLWLLFGMKGIIRRYRQEEYGAKSAICRAIISLAADCRGIRERRLWQVISSVFYVLANGALCMLFGWILSETRNGGMSSLAGFLAAVAILLLNGVSLVLTLRRIRRQNQIADALEKIASGEIGTKLPPEQFGGQCEEEAKAINAIGEGLSKAVEEQIRSERMKTELIANVSHDLRTPLTSIINYVDLIKREHTDNPRIQAYVEVLDSKSQRLKHLTEDLLEASRVSSGNMQVCWARIDLVQMISQVGGEFQEKLEQADLKVIPNLGTPPLYIQSDGRLLFRVLENLYNNCCKYAMPGTRVYIDLKETSHKAIFTMKNISKAPLNISAHELTERFVRGDSSRSTEGTGLGLSIAQSITELLQGSFEIYLEGDLFRVRLVFPLDEVDEEKNEKTKTI